VQNTPKIPVAKFGLSWFHLIHVHKLCCVQPDFFSKFGLSRFNPNWLNRFAAQTKKKLKIELSRLNPKKIQNRVEPAQPKFFSPLSFWPKKYKFFLS